MSFLLKIVEGPNKGAEIALVEGVAVTLGKTDDCDIVLADATFPESPVKLEATSTGVTVDGAALENFHVRTFGSTSFAIGPADAPWGDLAWSVREKERETEDDERAARDERRAESPHPSGPEPPPEGEKPAKRRRGCLGCLIAFVLLLLALAALGWFFRDQARPYVEKAWQTASGDAGEPRSGTAEASGVSTNETLPVLVARYTLAATNRNVDLVVFLVYYLDRHVAVHDIRLSKQQHDAVRRTRSGDKNGIGQM